MTRASIPLLLLLSAALCACAEGAGRSEEWRVRALEKQFLESQEKQRQLEARLAALESGKPIAAQTASRKQAQPAPPPPPPAKPAPAAQAAPARGPETGTQAAESPAAPAPQTPADRKPQVHDFMSMNNEAPRQAGPQTKPIERAQAPTGQAPVQAPSQAQAQAPSQAQAPAPAAIQAPAPAPEAMVDQGGGGKGPKEYEEALSLTRSGQTEKGRNLFRAFLAERPDSPFAPNALYWLGETYYRDQRYAQAILTFKEVTGKFPKHDKAAASLLKIGFSYAKLGDQNNARFYLQSLINEYPGSEPAGLAKNALQERGP